MGYLPHNNIKNKFHLIHLSHPYQSQLEPVEKGGGVTLESLRLRYGPCVWDIALEKSLS